MIILSIESSCDETACAVVRDGVFELASSLATSRELHEKTGGIVPEVASRKQVESIVPVISDTLEKFESVGGSVKDIDALAVTVGPGLAGSLLVGVEAAKALSLAWKKPLIPVNHLVGHIYSNFLVDPSGKSILEKDIFPAVVLVVSGGHTDLVLMRGHGDLEYLGGTVDDAAGEAFDKTARLLGLAKYLGGKELSDRAASCSENVLKGRLPRPMLNQNNFDFSFSGLKTAVKRLVEKEDHPVEAVACEFETAAVDVLVEKTLKAAKKYGVKTILLGGGVAANQTLRVRLSSEAQALSIEVYHPPLRLCGDNAVYIASAAFFNNKPVNISDVVMNPGLGVLD
jgi:N6-L-threonylcarbamoyladenine synthase